MQGGSTSAPSQSGQHGISAHGADIKTSLTQSNIDVLTSHFTVYDTESLLVLEPNAVALPLDTVRQSFNFLSTLETRVDC